MSDSKQKIDHSNDNRLLDGIGAALILLVAVVLAVWVGRAMSAGEVQTWHVFVAATITAVATGFGALPFLFIKELNKQWLGWGNALASWLMLGASTSIAIATDGTRGVVYVGLRGPGRLVKIQE